jgi:hypothetical protein
VFALIGVTACQDDVLGPANNEVNNDLIYNLTHVNGIEVPATAVEGTCAYFGIHPDTIRVDGGRLTLGSKKRYEIYYTWRGQTDACTVFGAHWHRISAGNYEFIGDRLVFAPDTAPSSGPTSNRGSSPGKPSGSRDGTHLLVDWGSLRLRFVLRGTMY